MDTIENPVEEMLQAIQSKAPSLRPAIFPSGMLISSLFDICSTNKHHEQLRQWMAINSENGCELAFETSVDYRFRSVKIHHVKFIDPLDAKLTSLESVLKRLALGSRDEYEIMVRRFLELNSPEVDFQTGSGLFQEVYNISYAIKVIISNVPMKVFIGENELPLNENVNISNLLDTLRKKKRKAENGLSGEKEDIDDEEDASSNKNMKTKRKKKRGGKHVKK